jgi:hypothetical protein
MKSAVAAVALLWCALTYAQKSISARDAKDHVGQKATVCGKCKLCGRESWQPYLPQS